MATRRQNLFYEDWFDDIPSPPDRIKASLITLEFYFQHNLWHGLRDDSHDIADLVVGSGLAVAGALAGEVGLVEGVVVLAGVIHVPHGLGRHLLDHPHGAVAAGLAQDLGDVDIDGGGALTVGADLHDISRTTRSAMVV